MRDHSKHIELSREEAVATMLKRCELPYRGDVVPWMEMVPITEAFGRVLADDVWSRVEMPNCLTCNMDSIAVRWADFEDGMPDTSAWIQGLNWEFANTGVAMPEGFDTAIVIEHVKVSDDGQHVQIDAAPSCQFAGTRPAGSQLKLHEAVAHRGDIVTPDIASRIASGNVVSVLVRRKPKVAFIPTGNELVAPGSAFVPTGRNIETNSLLARGKVEAWGGIFMPTGIVADDGDEIGTAVRTAAEYADIVVLNAGSSKGSDDWSIEQLEEMGEVICHQTNHGPGHHSSYAVVDGVPVVGISGPPMGASFTLDFYLRPLMRVFLGLEPEVSRVPVRLASSFPQGGPGGPSAKKPGEPLPGEARPREATDPGSVFYGIKFLNVRTEEDGSLVGEPVAGRPGSPEVRSANAYYMMPMGSGVKPPAAGDVIEIELK